MEILRPIDIPSVHHAVQERMKEYILGGKLRSGDPLPSEGQFAEQLCVSRAVVREALRSLESLGMIVSRRGEGWFVRDFNLDPIMHSLSYSMMYDAHDLLELMEVRERLEISFIGDAMSNIDRGTLAELQRIIMRVREGGPEERIDRHLIEPDKEFHCTLYRDIHNAVLVKLLGVFWDVFLALSTQALVQPDYDAGRFVRIHSELLHVVAAGDVDAARAYLPLHLADSRRRVRAAQQIAAVAAG